MQYAVYIFLTRLGGNKMLRGAAGLLICRLMFEKKKVTINKAVGEWHNLIYSADAQAVYLKIYSSLHRFKD